VQATLDRTRFLSLGARGGAALAIGGAAGSWAADARAAPAASGPLTELDLAQARLAVGAELLAIEFYTRAIASRKVRGDDLKDLRRTLRNEQDHLAAVSQILSGAGETPATADDFTFTFPKGTFASPRSIGRAGAALETILVGTYLGAVDAFTAGDLKTTAARIAASEAEHLSVFSGLASGRPVGISFPAPLDYETASDLLDPYLS
jgi:rubrerythrin